MSSHSPPIALLLIVSHVGPTFALSRAAQRHLTTDGKPRRLQRKLDLVLRPRKFRVNDSTSVLAAHAGSDGPGGPILRDTTDDGPRLKQTATFRFTDGGRITN